MVWTRRRCPECGQMLVEDEAVIASCPACGRDVGPESVLPEALTQEPVSDDDAPEREAQTQAEANEEQDVELPDNWNLGEPMHKVAWFCLTAPDRVPLATMFRSLRWVFSMAWIGQVILQGSFLLVGAAMLQAGAQELELLKQVAAAVEYSQQGGPEAQRQKTAQAQLCTLTMISPEQRLLCALQPALDSMSDIGAKASARIAAIERMRGPDHPEAWLRTLSDAFVGIFFSLLPLWGLLGMARHPQAWSVALKVVAFGQTPLVVCSLIGALMMQFAGSIGLSVGVMMLVSGVLWSLSLWVGLLIRIGSLIPRQAVVMVLMILLFNITLLTTLAGAA